MIGRKCDLFFIFVALNLAVLVLMFAHAHFRSRQPHGPSWGRNFCWWSGSS